MKKLTVQQKRELLKTAESFYNCDTLVKARAARAERAEREKIEDEDWLAKTKADYEQMTKEQRLNRLFK